MHVLHLACLVGGYWWHSLGLVGLVCMCCDWDWMDLGCCSATVCLLLFVVPQGVMVVVSGESWHHKSTLSPIPSSQGCMGILTILLSTCFLYFISFLFL